MIERMMKVFYIQINDEDETGMNAISLVDYPAVQRNFLCFDAEKKLNLQLRDEQKHIITGVVALADVPIYRYDPRLGEYWVVFTADTIQKMVLKYAKQGLFNSVNLDHDDNQFIDQVFMIESYIIDKEKNIAPKGFEDVPDGSWVCSFKIEDEQLWNEITQTEHYNGFSLQGIFSLVDKEMEEKDELDELIDSCLK